MKKYIRLLSLITLIFFSINTIATATPPHVYTIKIPEKYGTVKERWKAPDESSQSPEGNQKLPTVILVQDAHDNFDAQKNISKIITEVLPQLQKSEIRNQTTENRRQEIENSSLSSDFSPLTSDIVVGVEGAVGTIEYPSIRQYPVKEARESAALSMVKQGYFTGAEHAALLKTTPIELWGVEDEALFFDDYERFYDVLSQQDNVSTYMKNLHTTLDILKQEVYTGLLRKLDIEYNLYMSSKLSLYEYIEKFIEKSTKQGDLFESNTYPYLCLFKEIMSLSEHGNETETNRKLSLLDAGELINEIHQCTYDLEKKVASSQEEKRLIDLNRTLDSTTRVVTLQATRDDIEYFNKIYEKEKGSILSTLTEHVKSWSRKYELSFQMSTSECDMVSILKSAHTFYTLAQRRERAMLDNFLAHMDEQKTTSGVLVAGGYHTQGLARLLREKNISYLVITPRITNILHKTQYHDRMLGTLLGPLSPMTSYITVSRINILMSELCKQLGDGSYEAGEEIVRKNFETAWVHELMDNASWFSRLELLNNTDLDENLRKKVEAITALAKNVVIDSSVKNETDIDIEEYLQAYITQTDRVSFLKDIFRTRSEQLRSTYTARFKVQKKYPLHMRPFEVLCRIAVLLNRYGIVTTFSVLDENLKNTDITNVSLPEIENPVRYYNNELLPFSLNNNLWSERDGEKYVGEKHFIQLHFLSRYPLSDKRFKKIRIFFQQFFSNNIIADDGRHIDVQFSTVDNGMMYLSPEDWQRVCAQLGFVDYVDSDEDHSDNFAVIDPSAEYVEPEINPLDDGVSQQALLDAFTPDYKNEDMDRGDDGFLFEPSTDDPIDAATGTLVSTDQGRKYSVVMDLKGIKEMRKRDLQKRRKTTTLSDAAVAQSKKPVLETMLNAAKKEILQDSFFNEDDFDVKICIQSGNMSRSKETSKTKNYHKAAKYGKEGKIIYLNWHSFRNKDFLRIVLKHELTDIKLIHLFPDINPALRELITHLVVNINEFMKLCIEDHTRAQAFIDAYTRSDDEFRDGIAEESRGLFKRYVSILQEYKKNPKKFNTDPLSYCEEICRMIGSDDEKAYYPDIRRYMKNLVYRNGKISSTTIKLMKMRVSQYINLIQEKSAEDKEAPFALLSDIKKEDITPLIKRFLPYGDRIWYDLDGTKITLKIKVSQKANKFAYVYLDVNDDIDEVLKGRHNTLFGLTYHGWRRAFDRGYKYNEIQVDMKRNAPQHVYDDGVFRYANEGVPARLARTYSELLRKPVSELITELYSTDEEESLRNLCEKYFQEIGRGRQLSSESLLSIDNKVKAGKILFSETARKLRPVIKNIVRSRVNEWYPKLFLGTVDIQKHAIRDLPLWPVVGSSDIHSSLITWLPGARRPPPPLYKMSKRISLSDIFKLLGPQQQSLFGQEISSRGAGRIPFLSYLIYIVFKCVNKLLSHEKKIPYSRIKRIIAYEQWAVEQTLFWTVTYFPAHISLLTPLFGMGFVLSHYIFQKLISKEKRLCFSPPPAWSVGLIALANVGAIYAAHFGSLYLDTFYGMPYYVAMTKLMPAFFVFASSFHLILELIKIICDERRMMRQKELGDRNRYNIGIHEVDLTGKIISVNQEELRLLGYTKEEDMVGKFICDFINKEERKEAEERFKEKVKTFKNGENTESYVEPVPRRYVTAHGFERIFEAIDHPVYDADGNLTSILTVLKDITKQKRDQKRLEKLVEKLQETENRLERKIGELNETTKTVEEKEKELRLLIENVPVVTFRGKDDWSVRAISGKDNVKRLTGYDMTEHMRWYELIHEDDRKAASQTLRIALHNKAKTYEREYRVIKKDGSVIWAKEMGAIVYDDNGRLKYIDGVSFDITKRKEAEEKLRESEHKYRNLVHNVPGAIFKGYPNERFEVFDDATELILGIEAEYINYKVSDKDKGPSIYDFMHPDDREDMRQVFRNALTGTKRYERKYRLNITDETHFFMIPQDEIGERWIKEYGVISCDKNGDIHHVDGILFDITASERTAIEEKEREKAELHAAQARTVIHDIKNIFVIVMGHLEKWKEIRPEIFGDEAKIREVIEKSLLRADKIAKTLLASQKKQFIHPIEVCINTVIQSALDVFKNEIEKNNISVDFTSDDYCYIKADEEDVIAIFENLLTNAIDALVEGGKDDKKITIRVKSFDKFRKIRIDFSDNGCGIPKKNREKIWEPQWTTKEAGKGSGIGLSQIHNVITRRTLLDGSIMVKSVVNQGTTFTITIPGYCEQSYQEMQKYNGNGKATRPTQHREIRNILIMEDEPLIRDLYKDIFHGLEMYFVEYAKDEHEALRKINEKGLNSFDLIISDLSVPGNRHAGADLACAIRHLELTMWKHSQKIPFVLLTGQGSTSERVTSLGEGIIDQIADKDDIKEKFFVGLIQGVEGMTLAAVDEKALDAYRKKESSSQEKTEDAIPTDELVPHKIIHDLNNQLGGVIGYVELLAMSGMQDLDEINAKNQVIKKNINDLRVYMKLPPKRDEALDAVATVIKQYTAMISLLTGIMAQLRTIVYNNHLEDSKRDKVNKAITSAEGAVKIISAELDATYMKQSILRNGHGKKEQQLPMSNYNGIPVIGIAENSNEWHQLTSVLREVHNEFYGIVFTFKREGGKIVVSDKAEPDDADDSVLGIPRYILKNIIDAEDTEERSKAREKLKNMICAFGLWYESTAAQGVAKEAADLLMNDLTDAMKKRLDEKAYTADQLKNAGIRFVQEVYWRWMENTLSGSDELLIIAKSYGIEKMVKAIMARDSEEGYARSALLVSLYDLNETVPFGLPREILEHYLKLSRGDEDMSFLWNILAQPLGMIRQYLNRQSFDQNLHEALRNACNAFVKEEDAISFDSALLCAQDYLKNKKAETAIKIFVHNDIKQSREYTYIKKLFKQVEREGLVTVNTKVTEENADLILAFDDIREQIDFSKTILFSRKNFVLFTKQVMILHYLFNVITLAALNDDGAVDILPYVSQFRHDLNRTLQTVVSGLGDEIAQYLIRRQSFARAA